jgi:hypothetical protein
MRFEVFMALNIKITVFKDVMQCNLVEVSAFQRTAAPKDVCTLRIEGAGSFVFCPENGNSRVL